MRVFVTGASGFKRGFAGALIDAAQRSDFVGYLGDGSQRWPALHRQDAARLYRLAMEQAPAGAVLHGVGEQGDHPGLLDDLAHGEFFQGAQR